MTKEMTLIEDAKLLNINELEMGQMYEVCDKVIGRVDPSFIKLIEDKGDHFIGQNMVNLQNEKVSKNLDFYSLPVIDMPEDEIGEQA